VYARSYCDKYTVCFEIRPGVIQSDINKASRSIRWLHRVESAQLSIVRTVGVLSDLEGITRGKLCKCPLSAAVNLTLPGKSHKI
jgi:hypothetical protein